MTSLVGRTLSHFRIVEELSRGGMGIVYRAVDVNLGREVALKVLPPELVADPERRSRFVQEARAAAALVDARIAVVHEVDQAEGVTFIAMELIRGERLSTLLESGPLTASRALDLAVEIAEGLLKAHQKGIIHRDLKPGNVMVAEDGHAKIIDFGVAKLIEPLSHVDGDAETAAHLDSVAGVLFGTTFYMSPEQARGQTVDRRTDIFSFGIVFFEMLTGTPPFRGLSAFDVLRSIVEAPAPALRGVKDGATWPAVQRVLERCLAKRPEDRYPNVTDLLADLREVRARLDPITAETRWTSAPQTPFLGRLRRWPGIVVAAAVVLAGVIGILAIRGRRPPEARGASDVRSVVALPAQVHSEPTDAFLSDAIPSTISTYLNQIQELETKLPPTSVDMERVGGDLSKIADAYKVGAFVLSSVTAQAGRLALNVQLVEPRSRRLLWSHEFEGPRAEYLSLVREAAEGVRTAVRPRASPLAAPTAASEVELALQRGRHHLSRYGALYKPEDADQALASFRRVLELDPTQAEAAAATAVVYVRKAQFGDKPAYREAEKWAHRALAIDSRSSRAWAVLGFSERQRGRNRKTALEYALKAAAFDLRDPIIQANLGGIVMGDSGLLALASVQEARRLDPLYLNAAGAATDLLDLLNRRAESREVIDQTLRIEPESPLALFDKVKWLDEPSQAAERKAALERLEGMTVETRLDPRLMQYLTDLTLLKTGNDGQSRPALDRLRRIASGELQILSRETLALFGAIVLSRGGRRLDGLDLMARLDQSGAAIPYDVLLGNPHLATLRGDPRFETMLRRSRARLRASLDVLEDARKRTELPPYLHQPLTDAVRSFESGDPRIQ